MKRLFKLFGPSFLMFILLPLLLAQNESIAGHWTGTITKGDRSGTARLDLTDSDGKIAGTLSDPSGQVMRIENLKLEANRFTFDAWGKQHGQPEKLHFVGEVENGEIKLHRDRNREKSGPIIVFHRQGQ